MTKEDIEKMVDDIDSLHPSVREQINEAYARSEFYVPVMITDILDRNATLLANDKYKARGGMEGVSLDTLDKLDDIAEKIVDPSLYRTNQRLKRDREYLEEMQGMFHFQKAEPRKKSVAEEYMSGMFH